jgi:hypothetical protein
MLPAVEWPEIVDFIILNLLKRLLAMNCRNYLLDRMTDVIHPEKLVKWHYQKTVDINFDLYYTCSGM